MIKTDKNADSFWKNSSNRYLIFFIATLLVTFFLSYLLFFETPFNSLLAFLCGVLITFLFLAGRVLKATTKITSEGLLSSKEVTDPLFPQLNTLLKAHSQILEYNQHTIEELSDETDMLVDRYEVLTENLAAAIVIRDASGHIAYCSPYTEVLTGFKLEKIYSVKDSDFFLEIIHPDDREDYKKALRICSCGEAFQFRYRFYHRTGIEMWAETRTVPIMDDHGDLTSSLSITFDVTSLIRRQQQIEEKNRDLEDFSYMISHDLKAPIFTIKGMMQILQEDLQITTESSTWEIIQHINAATDRLEQLVQSVVDYSRVGIGESAEEVVNINSLLQDICNEITPQLSAVEGSISVTPAMPEVLGDRLKLYQIFSNLIGNAIKYRSPERKLEISITATYISPRYVQFLVKDNGLGIPSNRLQDIFRPFQRAHSKDIEGSGIGLACVKKLVSCLRGDVSVQSEVGVGSTFKVVLPLVEDSFFEAPDDNKLIQKKDEQ